LAKGVNPKDVRQESNSPTFKDFIDNDFIHFAKKKYKTYANVKSTVNAHLNPQFGKRRLSDIGKADVVRYHEKLCGEISCVTANRCLSMLSSIFNRAVDLELISSNPTSGVKKFHEGDGRDRFLNDEELGRFIHVLKLRMDDIQVKAIFLLLTLGLRKSEVLSFRWSGIDLTQKRVFLPDPKNRKPRYVALNTQAHALLVAMDAEKGTVDWVFPSKSKCGHLLEIRRTFASILKQANITEFRLHDVRRTMASHLINSGASIYEVKEILGHQDLRSTQVYARLATESIARTSEIMSRKVDEVMGG
jgi:integrase